MAPAGYYDTYGEYHVAAYYDSDSSSSSSDYDSPDDTDDYAPLFACHQRAKDAYRFCCSQHDPSVRRSFAPHMFAQSRLHAAKERELLQLDGDSDFYRANAALPASPALFHLDHILELQCFAFAFSEVADARRRGASVQPLLQLKTLVREEIANSNANLCLTRASTNQLKGSAVWRFLDDSVTGYRGNRCLYSYLEREQIAESGMTLCRSEMRSICRNMSGALRRCQNALNAAWGIPREARGELSDELDQLYDDMALGC